MVIFFVVGDASLAGAGNGRRIGVGLDVGNVLVLILGVLFLDS